MHELNLRKRILLLLLALIIPMYGKAVTAQQVAMPQKLFNIPHPNATSTEILNLQEVSSDQLSEDVIRIASYLAKPSPVFTYKTCEDAEFDDNEEYDIDDNIDNGDYENTDNEPVPYIQLTEDEIYELATLVWLESGTESLECQKAIASVVINRMTTTNRSLHDIIYAPNQFTPANRIDSNNPSEATLAAVRDVVENGPSVPEYVTYFRANYYFDWGPRYQNYINIDHTYFSYDTHLYELCTQAEV